MIFTVVDFLIAKVFAIDLNVSPVASLPIATPTRFSMGIAHLRWVSLFSNAGRTTCTISWNVSFFVRKSCYQKSLNVSSFNILLNQNSCRLYAHIFWGSCILIWRAAIYILEAKNLFLRKADLSLNICKSNLHFFLHFFFWTAGILLLKASVFYLTASSFN